MGDDGRDNMELFGKIGVENGDCEVQQIGFDLSQSIVEDQRR